MTTLSRIGVLALLLGSNAGCAHHHNPAVRIPPRVDLSQLETIGVIEFRTTSDSALSDLATSRFAESARRDQGLVRMVDLGSSAEALNSVGAGDLDADAYRALGAKHGVQTLLVGELSISKTRPSVRIDSAFRSGSVAAIVEATLAVRLIEASTGASIWSGSARASDSVGQLSVLGGNDVAVGTNDPQSVYAALVDQLVEQATSDFHAHWTR